MLIPLHDGRRVLLRDIEPEDAPLLVRAHSITSDEALQARFLSAKPRLSSGEVHYLTHVDRLDHVALVAVEVDRPEAIVAVGRWIRDRGRPDAAEAAFIVADDYQGVGLGSALAIALADRAVARGVRVLQGSMYTDNRGSVALFARMGGELTVVNEGITNEVRTTLPSATDRLERLVVRRRLRPGHDRPRRDRLRRVPRRRRQPHPQVGAVAA
ncbi:MAG: GNAT family N-acetyltransferase [Solirubrobacteraceae bacterium]|nr:GNAT family N-acetyltransferase [Solirubrobacteraceae bacterium]